MNIPDVWKKVVLVSICAILGLAGVGLGITAEKPLKQAEKRKVDHLKAFQIYKQKCLLCHDSVADPEKPGRTRDDWLLVVKTMHGYGLGLSPEETELVTELLYSLRAGMEKDPG
ncbi:MAG: cytochrome c [Thermodesulfobacteriota bacterium]